jgi:hypothetical protein
MMWWEVIEWVEMGAAGLPEQAVVDFSVVQMLV